MSSLLAASLPCDRRGGLRLFEIKGDACEPSLRRGDFFMVAAADRYAYATDYLLDFGDGEAPYMADLMPGGQVALWHRNPAYERWTVALADFNRAVRAIVVAEVKVKDARAVRMAYARELAS